YFDISDVRAVKQEAENAKLRQTLDSLDTIVRVLQKNKTSDIAAVAAGLAATQDSTTPEAELQSEQPTTVTSDASSQIAGVQSVVPGTSAVPSPLVDRRTDFEVNVHRYQGISPHAAFLYNHVQSN